MFLLDTDHIVIAQEQAEPEFTRIESRIQQHERSDFYLPIVSFHEQALGANVYISRAKTKDGHVRGYRIFQKLLTRFADAQVLPFDDAAAEIFDQLKKQRIRVGAMDLRIGSIALSHDMTVLTRNTVDFERIPGLKIEDWTIE